MGLYPLIHSTIEYFYYLLLPKWYRHILTLSNTKFHFFSCIIIFIIALFTALLYTCSYLISYFWILSLCTKPFKVMCTNYDTMLCFLFYLVSEKCANHGCSQHCNLTTGSCYCDATHQLGSDGKTCVGRCADF